MAMGDALALALLERRGFREEDFALLHPGGALGRKLLRVDDLMHVKDALPLVAEDDPMKAVLIEMTSKRLGLAGVVNEQGELTGIITDGDLRRGLERDINLLNHTAQEVMTANPKTIEKSALAQQALQKMEQYAITALFVVPATGRKMPHGVIHLHDILKAGIV
jgi:arabinose-5-phosphate isomerase